MRSSLFSDRVFITQRFAPEACNQARDHQTDQEQGLHELRLVLQKCSTSKRQCNKAKQKDVTRKELIDPIERFEKYFHRLTSLLIFIIH